MSAPLSAGHTTTVAGNADLLLFLVVGALAGAHCLGMCGPLVAAYADRIAPADRRARVTPRDVRQHGLFNLGRTAGYAAVGGALGFLGGPVVGAATALSPVSAVVRGGIGVVVGATILAAGVGYLLGGRVPRLLARVPLGGDLVGRAVGRLSEHVDSAASSTGIVALGTAHACLPCPILYPAYLYAFAVGDPVRGAVALGLLGVGTIPTLLAYGLAVGSVAVGHRERLHRVMGVAFVGLGYLPLAHGLLAFGVDLPAPPVPFYQPL